MVDLELDTLKTLFKDSAIMSEIVTLDSTGQANFGSPLLSQFDGELKVWGLLLGGPSLPDYFFL